MSQNFPRDFVSQYLLTNAKADLYLLLYKESILNRLSEEEVELLFLLTKDPVIGSLFNNKI